MKASPGDRLIVRGHAIGDEPRDGEVLEVHGPAGAPPYVVRWENGHVALVFPGPDAIVVPSHRSAKHRSRGSHASDRSDRKAG
ncbi:MAG TPA: DUF1918 domain-containing protein [Actinomycetota bacterium]|nr:DUF1918 domain-containing protein [Actinomycetota bacterium]